MLSAVHLDRYHGNKNRFWTYEYKNIYDKKETRKIFKETHKMKAEKEANPPHKYLTYSQCNYF